MSKEQIIPAFQNGVSDSPFDLRAEPVLLEALRNGLDDEDYMILCDRFFKRQFSKDLYETIVKDDKKKGSLLEIHLSRTGLYDQLPEGLFFQIPHRKSRQTTADAAHEYRENQKKEEEIRRFFSPFEQGFFRQRLKLEEEESLLLEGLRTGVLNDYFIGFWDLPASIPKMFMVPFILLLPYANKIAGDLSLTGQSLSYVLKEKVNLVLKQAEICYDQTGAPGLGAAGLGLDMVCGEQFFEDNPVIEIQIGPLMNSQVKDYLKGGKRESLMETFTRFFIPAGLDVITTIKIDAERQDMLLEKGAEPVLGYSSVLG